MALPKVVSLLALLGEVTESKVIDFEFESQEPLYAFRLRPSHKLMALGFLLVSDYRFKVRLQSVP